MKETGEGPKPSRTDRKLLAVDLGLSTGLALYGSDGRLMWYRSHHYGNRALLRRGVHGLLRQVEGLEWLVLEGGGPLADIWEREGGVRGLGLIRTSADHWRSALFPRRQWRGRAHAKTAAERLARRVIEWSGVQRPTALRHDTAEAVLIGLWGVIQVGWISGMPINA